MGKRVLDFKDSINIYYHAKVFNVNVDKSLFDVKYKDGSVQSKGGY